MTQPTPETKAADPAGTLRADGIVMRFGGIKALDGASIRIRPGDTIGLLGPNGSGKTTLVNCLTGILTPTEGRIVFNGQDITRRTPRQRAHGGIVRSFQNLRLMPDLTVAENVAVGLAGLAQPLRAAEWRDRLTTALAAQRLEPYAHSPLGQMPYGVMKRVEVARALVSRPRILLLDEPAAGLGGGDWEPLAETLKTAQEQMGFGLLLIDHNIEFVRALVNRLVVLATGQVLVEGSPETVLTDPEVGRVYLGSLADA
ncbi:ABC transporter ATP-binding protein [Chelativorans intermedius]|uniref:ABC transporter ATP-binding protein n=1 Tax=Chelativorans intermedius TaxID=515947 RepID=A0ABV6D9Q4_9HYPH|nr:ABC transporter ATP-binding protein [Chelativorans intermedius]MCT8999130.1 ABC transporter ATP-binding protein [Chelativorans intermedius]